MIIDMISDMHGMHNELDLPGGDVLIVAGDVLTMSSRNTLSSDNKPSGYSVEELASFLDWLRSQSYKHKVFVGGNHDEILEYYYESRGAFDIKEHFDFNGIHYLLDEEVIIEGVKFYGSPWQPEFFNWSFNLPRNGEELERVWSEIPYDVEVLITHSPPHGVLDTVKSGRSEGCELLKERVEELNSLKLHVFGHIHESSGMNEFPGKVVSVNASMMPWNERKSRHYPYRYEIKNN